MEKDVLLVLIVGLTILLVTVWISVDFCVYRKRKREARERKMFMFYNYGRRKRLAFPNLKDSKTRNESTANKEKKMKPLWKEAMSLFRRKKTMDALSRHARREKDNRSEITSSCVSDCLSEYCNSPDTAVERQKYLGDQPRSDKSWGNIKKRNSITPSDILTPNRMALSPIEMQSVFSVKDEAILYSSDFDEQSVSSHVSGSTNTDSIRIENESETTKLTKHNT